MPTISLPSRLQGNGTDSNRDAVGAKITLTVGDTTMVREIDTVAGAVQSEMAAFFGLGAADTVDELRIDWPSGRVETHQNVQPGALSFVEATGAVDSGL